MIRRPVSALAAALALLSTPALAQDKAADPAAPAAPAMSAVVPMDPAIDPGNILALDLSNGGRVLIRMMPNWAPAHVERVKALTSEGFYNGVVFHRVIDGFMAQTGDPTGTGQGGSKLPDLKAEFNYMPHVRGTVSMARTVLHRVLSAFRAGSSLHQFRPGYRRNGPGRCDPARRTAREPDQDRPGFAAQRGQGAAGPRGARSGGRDFGRHVEQFQAQLIVAAAPGLTRGRSGLGSAPPPQLPSGRGLPRQAMRVDLFDFDLPAANIALRPARPRDAARLLLAEGRGPLADHSVRDLPALLRKGDVLVFNDTRVIPAQLEGTRGAARIGATLHKRIDLRRWHAFVRNAKRLHPGDTITFPAGVEAVAESRAEDGSWTLCFAGDEPVEVLLNRAGHMPLPPYIAGKRATDDQDRSDYQTMFAARDGAVAAPTAALHFTQGLIAALDGAGIRRETLTLHVGAGTFLPVKAEDTADHRMHAEWGTIDAATADRLNAARAAGGRVIAVGTTSLRLLESATGADGVIQPFSGDTAIFITPGYRFKAIDGLMTNFHLPKSTLFMLVSALMGLERMQAAYAHAIEQGYRFYSYGDSSLLLP